MKGKARTYFIVGIIFIIAALFGYFNGDGSRTIAYCNTTMGVVFFALSARENKKDKGDKDDKDKKDDDK